MPRLSLYRENKSNDYRFIDRLANEQYTVGGLEMYVHKYLGPKTKEPSGDATQPSYSHSDPLFIEDLLLLENRNRKYEENIYRMRGAFNIQDLNFDLSQFGLFIQGETLFISWHYNTMIDTLGRKLMVGDVVEVPNLKDFHPLDQNLPKGLPKFYVIQDASFAAEGFSQTWYPHLWRTKAIPLVGQQEYNDILNRPIDEDDPLGGSLLDLISSNNKNLQINDAILQQASAEVAESGYETQSLYVLPTDNNGEPVKPSEHTPKTNGWTAGYLTGDGIPPNGHPATAGVNFPLNPVEGDFCLRLDYRPNRLFRYNGKIWIKVEDSVRTEITRSEENLNQRNSFVYNNGVVPTSDRGDIPSKQSLSRALKPKADF